MRILEKSGVEQTHEMITNNVQALMDVESDQEAFDCAASITDVKNTFTNELHSVGRGRTTYQKSRR